MLLDYTYGYGPFVEQTLAQATTVGRQVHSWLMTYSGAAGIRDRRRVLARMIDETAMSKPHPDVLSIACGHLRESLLSQALQHREHWEVCGHGPGRESLEVVGNTIRMERSSPVRCS